MTDNNIAVPVVICGPNLRTTGNQLHVHSPRCHDLTKYGPGRHYGGGELSPADTLVVGSMQELVESVYADMIEESGGEWREYLPEFDIFPCAELDRVPDDRHTITVRFSARRTGAIGMFEDYEVEVVADTYGEAVIALYGMNYEHIMTGVPASKRNGRT